MDVAIAGSETIREVEMRDVGVVGDGMGAIYSALHGSMYSSAAPTCMHGFDGQDDRCMHYFHIFGWFFREAEFLFSLEDNERKRW